ncbi:MAG: hypothetical protein CME06_01725 [Gemmatimonadetes bacterium]|nr:hypothetical protein [Gemmatimonadota bacterium]
MNDGQVFSLSLTQGLFWGGGGDPDDPNLKPASLMLMPMPCFWSSETAGWDAIVGTCFDQLPPGGSEGLLLLSETVAMARTEVLTQGESYWQQIHQELDITPLFLEWAANAGNNKGVYLQPYLRTQMDAYTSVYSSQETYINQWGRLAWEPHIEVYYHTQDPGTPPSQPLHLTFETKANNPSHEAYVLSDWNGGEANVLLVNPGGFDDQCLRIYTNQVDEDYFAEVRDLASGTVDFTAQWKKAIECQGFDANCECSGDPMEDDWFYVPIPIGPWDTKIVRIYQ